MNKQDFYNKFKEELNIRYLSTSAKSNKDTSVYLGRVMDEIDVIERIFDRLWKEMDQD